MGSLLWFLGGFGGWGEGRNGRSKESQQLTCDWTVCVISVGSGLTRWCPVIWAWPRGDQGRGVLTITISHARSWQV